LEVRMTRQRFFARPNRSGPHSRMRTILFTQLKMPALSRAWIAV
jgi:hypothetical protein